MSATSLAERMQWVIDNRANGNARNLARMAGIKSETHVGLVASGHTQNPGIHMIAAIASAARVNGHWLLTGEGSPELPADADREPPSTSGGALMQETKTQPPVKKAPGASKKSRNTG